MMISVLKLTNSAMEKGGTVTKAACNRGGRWDSGALFLLNNDDLLLKNDDFLLNNDDDLLLKNDGFINENVGFMKRK